MKVDAAAALAAQAVLASEEGILAGACVLPPGESFPNHFHTAHEEAFIVIEGRAELWTDRRHREELGPGSLAICRRGTHHLLRNTGRVAFRAYYLKAPNLPTDRVDVPWEPAQ